MTEEAAPLYLAVDAGNSKTAAVVADGAGEVLGYGRSGCGDIYSAATESVAVSEVLLAVRRALEMASLAEGSPSAVTPTSIARAAFCLAGVDWPADEIYWHQQLAYWLPELTRYSLRNDGFALLRAGEPSGVGVALSAGTGPAVVARGPDGTEWSASMWIVDPLGGSSLGAQAYSAVIRAELGLTARTVLREVALRRHGFTDVAEMLEATTRRGAVTIRHAALARDVLDAARAGDGVAAAIVSQQATSFAEYAVVAAERVGLAGPTVPVVLGGSVMSSVNPALRDATLEALLRLMPHARVAPTPRSPVLGALAEAIADDRGSLDPAVLDRLTAARFPADFLLT